MENSRNLPYYTCFLGLPLHLIAADIICEWHLTKVGDRVIVGGTRLGTLRFCGTTDFAPGVWAGVEYDEEEGKNDGTVQGVVYFKCPRNHGVFVLANKEPYYDVHKTFRNFDLTCRPML